MPRKVFPPRFAFMLNSPVRRIITPVDKRLTELGITPGMKVLDLGTGTGFLLPALVDRVGPSGHVFALDIQPVLLDQARARVPADAPVTFRVADASSTGLEDASIDAVILHHVFHEVQDRCGAIQEFRRILKTGGLVALWEPRFIVEEWQVRGVEGMFWGNRFSLERRWSTPLGFGRLFRADDSPVGSRLHTP